MQQATVPLTETDGRLLAGALKKKTGTFIPLLFLFVLSLYVMVALKPADLGNNAAVLYWFIAAGFPVISGLLCWSGIRSILPLRQDLENGVKTVESGIIEEKGSAGNGDARLLKVDGQWVGASLTITLKAQVGHVYERHLAPVSHKILSESVKPH